jgi:primosomal protein N' (replication factor Y)
LKNTPIARIALDVPLPGLFDYLAPGITAADIGCRVVVPFGRRTLAGVLVELASTSEHDLAALKQLSAVLPDMPALPPDILALCRFCARYYQHPLGPSIFTGLPVLLRRVSEFVEARPAGWQLTEAGREALPLQVSRRAKVQMALLALLQTQQCVAESELATLGTAARKALLGWAQQQWVERRLLDVAAPVLCESVKPALNAQQQAALTAIVGQLQGFNVWLLHGITGSGKTEVYLQSIAAALQQGRQVLVLVPEINLTPQLIQRFRQRFPGLPIVSLHSGLNDTERATHWLASQRGDVSIVLGTRLAVFTPMPRLGLIVVDEEHDGSFKQQDGLRYSARDVAIYRARQQQIPIILGSATPSLETYHHATSSRYRLLKLDQRANDAALPQVRCIDTRRAALVDGLAPQLLSALEQRLQRGEQSLVFINRRGYAPVLFCGDCGWAAACQRCSARMVVHLRERRLRCHHCGADEAIPIACPDCGNLDIKPLGQGTQRLETALAERFPDARILRIDRDSTRRKDAWDEIYRKVHNGEADILVGTQMLAKGHDFPDLSLVCVLNADSGLYSSDYRASERLFSMLVQVAGRAGRGQLAGEVLIQTQFPEHPLYQSVMRHDFDGYAQALLQERRDAGFPPFIYQALLRAEAPMLAQAEQFLRRAAQLAFDLAAPVSIFDPVAASLQRLAGKERAQLLVQHHHRGVLQAFLGHWLDALRALNERNVRWSLDVDPTEV